MNYLLCVCEWGGGENSYDRLSANFKYETVLLTLVTILYIRFPELIHPA